MKIIRSISNFFRYVVCILSLTVLLFGAVRAGVSSPVFGPEHRPSNYIVVKLLASSKLHKIRIFPDNANGKLFFNAEGEAGKSYQLFLFDMDSKLVSQTEVSNRQTISLKNLKKGSYLFQVFSDDTMIGNGSIAVDESIVVSR